MTQSANTKLPVVVSAIGASSERKSQDGSRFHSQEHARRHRAAADASLLDAHLAGQSFGRRGLKGGAPVLRAARAAYLGVQWSGVDDRRLPTGLLRAVSL